MNNTIKGILIGLIIVLLGWGLWMSLYAIPKLKNQLHEWENTPPVIEEVLIPGPIDTIVVYEKEVVRAPVVEDTEEVSRDGEVREYRTRFGDEALRGIVDNRVEGILLDTKVQYWFTKDIVSTHQRDIKQITITQNVVSYRSVPRRSLDVGLFAGGTVDGTVFLGPSVGFIDKRGNSFSYSYDFLNEGHFITYRKRLSFPKISLF